MDDCSNAEMRDALPDLLHGHLFPARSEEVTAHVAACAECAAELALLRTMRDSMRGVPAIDMVAVVSAVPAHVTTRRWSAIGWRVAAAITVLVGGGASLLMVRGVSEFDDTTPAVAEAPRAVPSTPPVAPSTPAPHSGVRVVPSTTPSVPAPLAGRELAMDGVSMGDLSDHELATLLSAIDELEAVPSVTVENEPPTPVSPVRASP